jgi:hypothetical protein
MDCSKEYLLVLVESRQLRVYNMMTMKQIAEEELSPKAGEVVEMECDRSNSLVLIRYINAISRLVEGNRVYRVNTGYYFGVGINYH